MRGLRSICYLERRLDEQVFFILLCFESLGRKLDGPTYLEHDVLFLHPDFKCEMILRLGRRFRSCVAGD